MEPYENMYIGMFILYLGFLAHEEGYKIEDCAVQLLQQTPADKNVGDLLSNFKGKSVIIEFKRNKNSIKSEIIKPKWEELKKNLSSQDSKKDLKKISRKAHFLGYPVFLESNKSKLSKSKLKEIPFKFTPYIDKLFQEEPTKNSLKISGPVLYDWKEFCEKLLKREIGVSIEKLEKYLKILNKIQQSDKDGSGFCTGGLFISISEDGQPVILYFKDYKNLAETIKKFTANRNNCNRNNTYRKPKKPRMRI